MGTGVLVLSEDQIRELIDRDRALDRVREAFVALARGGVVQPDVLSLDLVEQRGEVHAKGAYLKGAPFFSIKVASGFYDNPARGLPTASGAVWVFDATTGALRAMLLDNGYLTDLRTAAAGALASDLLARRDAKTVAILGTGGQARHQLLALQRVRELTTVRVWGRRQDQAEQYANEMLRATGIPVGVAETVREAVDGADIVVTATASRDPLVAAEWVAPGTHVTAMGSDMPGKVELAPELLARAGVFCDRLQQCASQGEVAYAVEAGAFSVDAIRGELGEVAAEAIPGRRDEIEVTVADLTGVGATDAAVANAVTSEALERGTGTKLDV